MLGQVFAIASGKGGTGKTSLCANMGIALCALGEKVLVIDADVGLRCLDIVLDMSDRAVFSYGDVICGRATLKQAAVTHPIVKNLYLLTAPASFDEREAMNAKNIDAFLRYARRHFSYILVDCAAGIGGLNVAFGGCADVSVVITTPDETAVRGAQTMAGKISDAGCKDIKLVVNRVRSHDIKRGYRPDIDKIMDMVGRNLLGLIPEDKDVSRLANKSKMLLFYSDGRAVRAYGNIARRIRGERVPLMKI